MEKKIEVAEKFINGGELVHSMPSDDTFEQKLQSLCELLSALMGEALKNPTSKNIGFVALASALWDWIVDEAEKIDLIHRLYHSSNS